MRKVSKKKLSIPNIRLANRCVLIAQITNCKSQLNYRRFCRKLAEKSRNEIADRCVSKSLNPNHSGLKFAFQTARTGQRCPDFHKYKSAAISRGCDSNRGVFAFSKSQHFRDAKLQNEVLEFCVLFIVVLPPTFKGIQTLPP